MPPKQTKAATRGKSEDTKEDPLQAVIVADTFETKFAPFSIDRPRCLLPLANTPLIEYTLEFLARSGVQEVFLYAGAHVEQVEAYINASKWTSSASPFSKLEFLRTIASSVGDVMRDLDQKQKMAGDFLCVSGDVVSDFAISKALRAHKQRREKDKNAIMTLLLRERALGDSGSSHSMIPTFVVDPTKDRILHYEETISGVGFGAHIEPEILQNAELDIRQDLVDCRIDICTPDVLSLWSDNFDNQRPRKDFLFGVLKDYELNGKTIHSYVVEEAFAQRVEDHSTYASITSDLQKGIASGLSLDNNVSGARFKRKRGHVANEEDVVIQRPSRLEHGSIAGSGTSIGAGCQIRKTVLGRRCQIGKMAKLNSAYIWDDVTIGNNVTVNRAIIGNECFIGDNCIIEEGALISHRVELASGTTILAGARVFDPAETKGNKTGKPVSGGSKGQMFEPEDEEDDYNPQWSRSLYQNRDFNESTSSLASDVSEVSAPLSQDNSRSQSFATHASDEDGTERFQHDTVAILVQRMQDKQKSDDMQSELMGLRFSGGADESQVRRSVAVALAKFIHNEVASGAKTADKASRNALEDYRYLIRRENGEQTTSEQVSFLLDVQKELSHRKDGAKVMPFLVKDLYDLEVFEEEAFTSWFEDLRSQEADVAAVRTAASPFINWLEEADEESDDEDEDSEDDD